MAAALADALPDFGSRQASGGGRVSPAPAIAVEAFDAEAALAQKIDAEVLRAREELRTELAAAHEAEMEALRETHRTELSDLQQVLGEKAAATIASTFADTEQKLRSIIGNAVARALAALMSDDLCDRSVEALGKAVSAALADREAVTLRIAGPAHLAERLLPLLGDHAAQAQFEEASGLDLTVEIDGSLIETRIGEWSAAIAEILA